jgi:hypothetical protein
MMNVAFEGGGNDYLKGGGNDEDLAGGVRNDRQERKLDPSEPRVVTLAHFA